VMVAGEAIPAGECALASGADAVQLSGGSRCLLAQPVTAGG